MTNKFSQTSVALYFKESFAITNEIIDELWKIAETESEKQELKKLWLIKNKYEETAGALTFAERKVNLESIDKSFNTLEDQFMKDVKNLTDKEKKVFLAKVKKAVDSKDYATLQKLELKFSGKLAKLYSNVMKNFFETGKKTASDEMSVAVPSTSKDISGLYRAQSLEIENKIANETGTIWKEEAFLNIQKGVEASIIMQQVEKAMDQKLQKILNASISPAMGGAFNTWRLAVFETHPDKIYAFQYTAVLDRRTTNLCMSLNGRIVAKDDPDFYRLTPPNHPRCRSFWVEILNDEFVKPKIWKIPDSISRDNTWYTNFQDLQKIQVYKPEVGNSWKRKDEVVNDVISQIRERLKNK